MSSRGILLVGTYTALVILGWAFAMNLGRDAHRHVAVRQAPRVAGHLRAARGANRENGLVFGVKHDRRAHASRARSRPQSDDHPSGALARRHRVGRVGGTLRVTLRRSARRRWSAGEGTDHARRGPRHRLEHEIVRRFRRDHPGWEYRYGLREMVEEIVEAATSRFERAG